MAAATVNPASSVLLEPGVAHAVLQVHSGFMCDIFLELWQIIIIICFLLPLLFLHTLIVLL